MSKLEELIARLCPDGVEYKEIKTISKVLRGKRLTKNQLLDNGKYPVYHGGLEPLGFYNESNRSANTVMIINVGASAGTVGFCDTDFWSSDGCFCLEHSISCIDKYLYYFLTTIENTIKSRVRHAGIPTLDAQIIDKIKVPVPPLDVQREIVHILDSYTASNKELKEQLDKELAARQRQYEWYRDMLLTFDDVHARGTNVECLEYQYVPLGSISTIARGASPRPIKNFITDSLEGVNWIKIGDVKAGSKYITETAERITREGAKKSRLVKKGDFVLSNSMSFGRPYIMKIDGCIHDGWLSISDFSHYFLPDFLYHLLNSDIYQSIMRQKASFGGAVQNLNSDIIKGMLVPLVPLSEQQRIVDILDRFDALCNDITSGLPAEIEARKKQYEYYRDKLLTFKELKKEA